MAQPLSFLGTGPRLSAAGGVLRARTSLFGAVCMLGACLKTMEADPAARVVRLRWLVLLVPFTRTIPFDQIAGISRRYADLNPLSGWTAANSFDKYAVDLELKDGSRITLFRWLGFGEFSNASIYPDILFWDQYLFDLRGTQGDRSLAFLDALKAMVFPRRPPATAHLPAAPPPDAAPRKPGVRPWGG